MAAKPTIYKVSVALSDMDRDYYDSLQLTIARHPSETMERMMVRLLAYCFQVREGLSFGRGLSTSDEPDLWAHELDGTLALWIDVGEPAVDRIRKASRIAREVVVYSFNSKSSVWWAQNREQFADLKASAYRFDWVEVQALTALADRTMDMSVSISDGTAWVTLEQGSCEIRVEVLQDPE